MAKNKTNWRTISFIVSLMIIITILAGILLMTEDVTKNKYMFSVLIGITSSLVAWLVIFMVLNKYFVPLNEKIFIGLDEIRKSILTRDSYDNTNQEINRRFDDLCASFKPHDKTTQTILNVLQGHFMTLIQHDRRQLLGTGFYDDLYKEADDVKISGITLNELIEAMCKENRSKGNLINQLLERKGVSVEMLLLHPESDFVKILDSQEGSGIDRNPVKKQITHVIDLLQKFSQDDEGLLQSGSKIEIALTSESVNSIITYAGKRNNRQEDVLLMGLLFGHKRGGPLYRIPNTQNNELYSDCIMYFDKLFGEARKSTVFAWSDTKPKTFNKNILNLSKL